MSRNKSLKPKGTQPNWKGRVMDTLYTLLVAAAGLAAVLWMGTKLFLYVESKCRPAREMLVGTFTAGGGTLPNDSTAVGKTLASKLERLWRYARHDPSGFGLIRSPVLISVPTPARDRPTDAGQRLEGLNLKVKDVDVSQMVKLMRAFFEPARPTLVGTITDYGDRLEVRSEVVWKSQVLDGWVASRPKDPQWEPTKTNQALNELYDDLLFQMIFDIPRNPDLSWLAKPAATGDTPNWQTLEAMTLGLESLEAYQQTLQYEDLLRALRYLERIPIYAPEYAVGHYFLGLALGEDRNEERARSVFEQIAEMKAPSDLKWTARFQEAAAMLRLYDGRAAMDAAQCVLEPLIGDLRAAVSQHRNTGEFARRLLPLAEAQLAYTYGTLFTLTTSISKEDLERLATNASTAARADFDDAAKDWPDPDQRDDVLSWLRNTEGYAKFRIAQWRWMETKTPDNEPTDVFQARCNEALDLINEAIRLRPNHYEILQNKAMILDDWRFDTKDTFLSEAQALYERTAQFVPRDYYQYERLARIYWRRARIQPDPTMCQDLIAKGLDYVKKMQSVGRSNSRTGTLCGAYFSILAAAGETDPAKKKEEVQAAIGHGRLALLLQALSDPDKKLIAKDVAAMMEKVAPKLDSNDENKSTLLELAKELTH
jgi:tetratricopeptide (TPR) repeat protein